jgi:hypothetical protein
MSGPTIQELFFYWPNLYLTIMLVYLLQNALVLHGVRAVVRHDELKSHCVDQQQIFYMHVTKRWTFSFARKSPLFSVLDIFQSFVLCYTILPFVLCYTIPPFVLLHCTTICVMLHYTTICVMLHYPTICVMLHYTTICVMLHYTTISATKQKKNGQSDSIFLHEAANANNMFSQSLCQVISHQYDLCEYL